MKKLIYLVALFCTIPLISQEQSNTISVIGETEKTIIDQNYTVIIALQQIMVYDGQVEVEATSLEDVTRNYIKKLNEAGIDFSRFRRNTYYELAMSYGQNRETAYYYLKTTNKDEARKIINLKASGVSVASSEVEPKKLTDKELAALSTKAIENAREKAELIAKKLNKTIGKIVSISDQNTNTQYIQSYGTTSLQPHSVTIAFELK
ncbi:SIMPL domain-containing protein [Algibacter sp. TI.3.09]|uniref:SIMPL domain-containing protein n=1 Tax=Algibacter sp. TI.3.09 TaxID=3121298 RepID=UPI00311DF9E9